MEETGGRGRLGERCRLTSVRWRGCGLSGQPFGHSTAQAGLCHTGGGGCGAAAGPGILAKVALGCGRPPGQGTPRQAAQRQARGPTVTA